MNYLKDAVENRIYELCKERDITINMLATYAGVTPSTIYTLLDKRRKTVQLRTLKIICDGLEITLAEFFNTDEFNALEQEIQ